MLSGDALKRLLADHGVDPDRFAAPVDTAAGRVERLLLPGADAVATWRRLRRLLPQSGRAPIVVAGLADADIVEALTISVAERAAVLDRAESLDVERWLAARAEGGSDGDDDPLAEDDDLDDELDLDMDEILGEVMDELAELAGEFGIDPADLPQVGSAGERDFSLPYEVLGGGPLARVDLLLLPGDRSWEAPAWLGFGGWNDCPEPFEQIAVLASWRRRYGAEVFGLGADQLELEVSRPPRDADEASALAREQYAYCFDLVDQGYLSLARLAADLPGRTIWSFWWD